MEFKDRNYGGSEQFRKYPSGFASPIASTGSNPNFGGSYDKPNTRYESQNFQSTGFQNRYPMLFQQTETDPRKVYAKRKDGLTKLRNVGVANLILAVLTTAVGVATLVVASPNIGFPVFNFGILLVGILHVISGMLCFLAGKNGLNSISETTLDIPQSVKLYIVGQFVVSVFLITLSILAAVFAILSGAVCAGADIKFNSRNNGEVKEIDVKQYCEPHDDANSALAFVGGGLCILIAMMSIHGTIWICCYGTVFGWRRYGGRLVYA